MKKIIISMGALMISWAGLAQKNDSAYVSKKLKVEEINLVSSYYAQDGNNSAVTGGKGTEKLWDAANSIELKLSKYDNRNRQHTLSTEFNIDYYSSASSDNIDLSTTSGASREDTHIYPSITWALKDESKGTNFMVNASYSTEWDYQSIGGVVGYTKLFNHNNTEVSLKGSIFKDTWIPILPAELRPEGYPDGFGGDKDQIATKPRNSYNASLTISQVINQRLQLGFMIEPSYQEGLLSTPYHRVYFNNGKVSNERLPGSRFKLPAGLRASYFYGDNLIFRAFYRAYVDNWGMTAHTASLEVPYKISPFLTISPFYRGNIQKAVNYFGAYGTASPSLLYHTSDYDLSSFNSHFLGLGVKNTPPSGIMGISHFHTLELRGGVYYRSNGLLAGIITLAVKLK